MSSNLKYFYMNQNNFGTIFLRFSMEEQSFLLLLISFKSKKTYELLEFIVRQFINYLSSIAI